VKKLLKLIKKKLKKNISFIVLREVPQGPELPFGKQSS
jgi:hypothetical protein